MDFTGRTSKYIRKRLRQKGLVKNTSQTGNKTSQVRTLGDVRKKTGKADPIVQSPYSIEKQDPNDAKYKSEFQWLFDPVKGVSWDFNPVALRQLAQGDAWVQMLVNTMTTEIANTPWQIVEEDGSEVQKNFNPYKRVSKGLSKEPAESLDAKKARQFLQNPNPDQDFTDFIESIMADYLEIGSLTSVKAFSEDDYDGETLDSKNPELIHTLPSDPVTWTKEYRDKTGLISGYWQYDRSKGSQSNQLRTTSAGRAQPTRFSKKEVGWKDINPRNNRRYGFPPTLAVRGVLQLMDLTVEQEQDFLARGAHLAGFLKSNGDIEEVDALQNENQGEQGRVGGFFHTTDPDAEWVQMGSNWKEMDMTEREKWYAQVIASEFQVPTSVVGLETEELNRATFEAERGNFESNTLGPYLQDLERWITQNFVKPHFGQDLRFEWKPGMSENQRKSISDRIRQEFNSQLITRNEARREIGYKQVEDESEEGFKEDVTEDSVDPQQLQMSSFSKEQTGKPFGPFDDFDGCVAHMQQEQDYTEEEAKRVCGSLQAELKKQSIDTKPTQEMANVASTVLEKIDDPDLNNDDCATRTGLERANQLENREELSEDTINRMVSFFARHDGNQEINEGVDNKWEDCGFVAWELWGGDPGRDWAERKQEEFEQAENSENTDKECEQCGDSIEKDNKRFCSKNCYHDFLSKDDSQAEYEEDNADEDDDYEPLRGSDNFFEYDFQPRHVEQFKDELQGPLRKTLEEIFTNDRFQQLIERFAEDESHDNTTEKNSAELRRVLNELIKNTAMSKGLEQVIQDQNTSIAVATLQDQIKDTGLDMDMDEVRQRIESREMNFVNQFSNRMEEELRDTISRGWQEGQSIQDIQESLQSKADDLTDYQAERIARDQLQRSTGEARNAFAEKHSDKFVEVWRSVSDNRTREAHSDMEGKWKRAGENFLVDYERANGTIEEKFPGDSEYGIQCRCRTDLVTPQEVNQKDYSGTGTA